MHPVAANTGRLASILGPEAPSRSVGTGEVITPRGGGEGGGAGETPVMFIAELARRVGRSTDTIKSWEEQGLLTPARDAQDRRVFSEDDVHLGLKLAELAIAAKRRSQKLSELVAAEPVQLSLIGSELEHRTSGKRVSTSLGKQDDGI